MKVDISSGIVSDWYFKLSPSSGTMTAKIGRVISEESSLYRLSADTYDAVDRVSFMQILTIDGSITYSFRTDASHGCKNTLSLASDSTYIYGVMRCVSLTDNHIYFRYTISTQAFSVLSGSSQAYSNIAYGTVSVYNL